MGLEPRRMRTLLQKLGLLLSTEAEYRRQVFAYELFSTAEDRAPSLNCVALHRTFARITSTELRGIAPLTSDIHELRM